MLYDYHSHYVMSKTSFSELSLKICLSRRKKKDHIHEEEEKVAQLQRDEDNRTMGVECGDGREKLEVIVVRG